MRIPRVTARAKDKASATVGARGLKMVRAMVPDVEKPEVSGMVRVKDVARRWARGMRRVKDAAWQLVPVMAALAAADSAGTGNAYPLIRCLGCRDSGWGASPANR